MTDWEQWARKLADALENVLSGDEDMPTHAADVERADDLLEEFRRLSDG